MFSHLRMVNKQFHYVCNQSRLWKNVTLKNCTDTNKFLKCYGKHIQSLCIEKTRWTRRNSHCVRLLSGLKCLDLHRVFKSSLIDDRFCYLLENLRLHELRLPASNITQCGVESLCEQRQLKVLEMSENNYIQPSAMGLLMTALKETLTSLTFRSVKAINDETLCVMSKLQLSNLQVTLCPVTTEGIFQFSLEENMNLKTCLFHGVYINQATIQNFSKNCGNIDTFAFNSYEHSMSEYSMLPLLKQLRTLFLISCQPIFNLLFLEQSKIKFLYLCRTPLVIDSDQQYREMLEILKKLHCDLKICKDTKMFF
jgi:hypothetical protein